MNSPLFNFESLRKAAIAVAMERTSDVILCAPDFCFTLISRNGIIQDYFFGSKRQAEWRLVEVRLYIAADILRVDIWWSLVKIWEHIREGQEQSEICPPVGDWTEWLPKAWGTCDDDVTPPYYDTDVVVDRITIRE